MTPKQYNEVNELIAEYSEICAELEKTEAKIKMLQLDVARSLLPEHAKLQMRLGELEEKLRARAEEHQAELFTEAGKRTHATPFGSMKFHRSTSLEFDDAEKVITKIHLRESEGELTAGIYVREVEQPNLETLETLDEDILRGLGIRRVVKDNFTVKPFAMRADKPAKKEAA